jgi:hypothetical protein
MSGGMQKRQTRAASSQGTGSPAAGPKIGRSSNGSSPGVQRQRQEAPVLVRVHFGKNWAGQTKCTYEELEANVSGLSSSSSHGEVLKALGDFIAELKKRKGVELIGTAFSGDFAFVEGKTQDTCKFTTATSFVKDFEDAQTTKIYDEDGDGECHNSGNWDIGIWARLIKEPKKITAKEQSRALGKRGFKALGEVQIAVRREVQREDGAGGEIFTAPFSNPIRVDGLGFGDCDSSQEQIEHLLAFVQDTYDTHYLDIGSDDDGGAGALALLGADQYLPALYVALKSNGNEVRVLAGASGELSGMCTRGRVLHVACARKVDEGQTLPVKKEKKSSNTERREKGWTLAIHAREFRDLVDNRYPGVMLQYNADHPLRKIFLTKSQFQRWATGSIQNEPGMKKITAEDKYEDIKYTHIPDFANMTTVFGVIRGAPSPESPDAGGGGGGSGNAAAMGVLLGNLNKKTEMEMAALQSPSPAAAPAAPAAAAAAAAAAPAAAAAAAAAPAVDPSGQIAALKEARAEGFISEGEYRAALRRALGI